MSGDHQMDEVGEVAERLFNLYRRHHSSSSPTAIETPAPAPVGKRAVSPTVHDYLYVDRDRVDMYFEQMADAVPNGGPASAYAQAVRAAETNRHSGNLPYKKLKAVDP